MILTIQSGRNLLLSCSYLFQLRELFVPLIFYNSAPKYYYYRFCFMNGNVTLTQYSDIAVFLL